jgi:beta-lactamase superfamily II metal-dependent hydrolase
VTNILLGTPNAGNPVLTYLDKVVVNKLDAMIEAHPHYNHAGRFIAILNVIKDGTLKDDLFFDNR